MLRRRSEKMKASFHFHSSLAAIKRFPSRPFMARQAVFPHEIASILQSTTVVSITDSVAEKDFGISRGMIGFDREIDASMCMAEVESFLKNSKL